MGTSTGAADVVVLGAGLAGLSASLAFARSGRRVLLVERDGPGATGSADLIFDRWDRPGIAHFRQPHNFLALARRVLLEQAPDVLDTALRLGATENRQYELLPGSAQPDDETFVSICARRPVVEYALRRAVQAKDNVTLKDKSRVVALLDDGGLGRGRMRVSGVRTRRGEEIYADLIVERSGAPRPSAPGWRRGGRDRCSSAELTAACCTTAATSGSAMA
jgi:2-polyprenyl-6-methoxyphenol hydroxylase-like FAD-dependent oxidoreductase